MKTFRKQLVIAFTALLLASCSQDPGPVIPRGDLPNFNHRGLYVVNEGSFTQGNSSLTFVDLFEGKSYNDLFNTVNKRPLGDVFQSMYFHNGKGYLVVNNSQKIEVVDSVSMQSLATISGLDSPRKVLAFGSKGYISDLYSNTMQVFDLNTNAITKTFQTGGWTESMLSYNNKIYATVQQAFGNNTPGSRKGLLVIDPVADTIETYIPLAQGAESLVLDKDGFIWVLCNGGYLEEVGGLFRIHPPTKTVERSILFPAIGYSGSSLQVNRAGDRIYFIYSTPSFDNDILSVPVNATSLPTSPLLAGNGKFIYGFGLNEFRNELYLTVPVFGVQNGHLYRYTIDAGAKVDSFEVGIFPSQILRNQN
jgi:hypothetical protein